MGVAFWSAKCVCVHLGSCLVLMSYDACEKIGWIDSVGDEVMLEY